MMVKDLIHDLEKGDRTAEMLLSKPSTMEVDINSVRFFDWPNPLIDGFGNAWHQSAWNGVGLAADTRMQSSQNIRNLQMAANAFGVGMSNLQTQSQWGK